jgi:hypothetical protein
MFEGQAPALMTRPGQFGVVFLLRSPTVPCWLARADVELERVSPQPAAQTSGALLRSVRAGLSFEQGQHLPVGVGGWR